jgi:hypothetical protein
MALGINVRNQKIEVSMRKCECLKGRCGSRRLNQEASGALEAQPNYANAAYELCLLAAQSAVCNSVFNTPPDLPTKPQPSARFALDSSPQL